VAASIQKCREVFLFVASLGDFNVMSSQDPKRIKLDLALEMFKEVMETEEFKEKSTILLLNKFDVLQDKIKQNIDPVWNSWPIGKEAIA